MFTGPVRGEGSNDNNRTYCGVLAGMGLAQNIESRSSSFSLKSTELVHSLETSNTGL